MKFFVFLAVWSILFVACQPNVKDKAVTTLNSDSISFRNTEGLIPVFGFMNIERNSLIGLTGQDSNFPTNMHFALVEEQFIPITYIQKKEPTHEDNGRQIAYNFHATGGQLYKLDTAVSSGDFALLVDSNFTRTQQIVPFTNANQETSMRTWKLLEKRYKRKIAKSRKIAIVNDQEEFHVSIFELQGDSALAVCSYTNAEQLITIDFPAKFDPFSTWRVDDGGEFHIDSFQLLSVLKDGNKIGLVTVFWGPEGYDLNYYSSQGNSFKSISSAYGYAAPL